MKIFSTSIRGLVVAIVISSSSASIACTCLYMGVFEEYVSEHPIVVRGTVLKYGKPLTNRSGYFKTMTVAVSETIKGEFSHSEFQFFGDTGMSCLRYISMDDYPIGSEHLFILESEEPVQPLMVCGESSVQIIGNTVNGHSLHGGGYQTYERDLNEFLETIR